MTLAVLLLRCLSVALQAACLVMLVTRRLERRYPVFCAFTLLGVLQAIWFPGGWNAWILAAIYGAVAIEACAAQARHFKSLSSFAFGAIVVFAVLSAGAGATVSLFGADILRDSGPVLVMCASCGLLLILSTSFFITFPVTMRANVRWHVMILLVLLGGAAASIGLASMMAPEGQVAARILAQVCPLVCYALWTFKLTPSGECFLPLSEIPAEVLAKLMAREPAPPAMPQPPRRMPSGRAEQRKARRLRFKAGQQA